MEPLLPASPAPWSALHRIVLRTVCVLTLIGVLHLVGFVGDFIPFPSWKPSVEAVLNPIGNTEMRVTSSVGVFVVSRLAGDREPIADVRRRYGRVRMRVAARYSAALVVIAYAIVKIIPTQFGYLTPGELLRPVGQQTRFWVLWNFMAVSTTYTVFTGLVELTGAILLLFHRTVVVGALLLAATLVNVAMMDVAYRVGTGALVVAVVLLVFVAIILAPYVRPLTELILRRQAALPTEPVSCRPAWRYGALLKTAAIIILLVAPVRSGLEKRRAYFGAGHPVYGLFDVESFSRNGATVDPLANDGTVWKRLASDGRYGEPALTVQFANGHVQRYGLIHDPDGDVWRLRESSIDAATLRFTTDPDGAVRLDGRIGEDAVQLRLRSVDLRQFPVF